MITNALNQGEAYSPCKLTTFFAGNLSTVDYRLRCELPCERQRECNALCACEDTCPSTGHCECEACLKLDQDATRDASYLALVSDPNTLVRACSSLSLRVPVAHVFACVRAVCDCGCAIPQCGSTPTAQSAMLTSTKTPCRTPVAHILISRFITLLCQASAQGWGRAARQPTVCCIPFEHMPFPSLTHTIAWYCRSPSRQSSCLGWLRWAWTSSPTSPSQRTPGYQTF